MQCRMDSDGVRIMPVSVVGSSVLVRLMAAIVAAGLTLACVSMAPDEGFLIPPLPALAPFERTDKAELLDLLLQPDFSVPTHLRPCCAFGYGLSVDVGPLPLPAVQVRNVLDPEQLGNHTYNGGIVSTKHGIREGFVSSERNGLVYTCRGGFIDIAHVRDYADWTVFLSRRLEATLATGGAFELPEEGARRFVFLTALDADLIARVGRRALAVEIAQWLAFQLSVWHETATWYGWSSIELFPERVSAFSPEDLYSNLLGIHLGSYLVLSGAGETEEGFNRGMDEAIRDVLRRLGAMPPAATRRALDSIDGLWWDSQERLPSERVVLRRNMSLGPELVPWRIPQSRAVGNSADEWERLCAGLPQSAVRLRYATQVEGIPFDQIAKLDLLLENPLAARVPLPDPQSHWLDQRDLPGIVERIRVENAREFGPGHDGPGDFSEAP